MRWTWFWIYSLLTLLIYGHGLHGELIMDDWGYITQNPWITQASTPLAFWTRFDQVDYWPLSYTYYWISFRLFNDPPFCYHLINLCIHTFSAFLVSELSRK